MSGRGGRERSMEANIRHLGTGLMLGFVVLLVMLSYVQVIDADDLNARPGNGRRLIADLDRPRGSIVSADDALLAVTEEVPDATYGFQRRYPTGELFAHITGHFGLLVQSTGLERSFNAELSGRDLGRGLERLRSMLDDGDGTGTLRISIDSTVQDAARTALGDRKGSVVAIDPRTGRLLALWSWPSYDPNLVASPDQQAAIDAFEALDQDDRQPLLGRTWRERFFPGSTFKIVTAASALDKEPALDPERVWGASDGYQPPGTTREVRNYGGATCGGDLFEIIARSCNTAFSQMAVEEIGPLALVEYAEAFGFNAVPPFDLERGVESTFPTDYAQRGDSDVFDDLPRLAQTAIGQNDVQATPLQMTLVAAGVANGGAVMKPRLVTEVLDSEGGRVRTVGGEVWRRPIGPVAAATLAQGMVATVESGTATRLAIPGARVGAKTGTAQLGTDPPRSHAWVIGFAGPELGEATVAFAVVVEADPEDPGMTGGATAAPVARPVIEAILASQAPLAGEPAQEP